MTHYKIFIVIVGLLVSFSLAHAQESKTQTADAARRDKAIDLLESVATQLPSLQSAENRARIGANIADSLWTHDEKRARALFISIEDDINWGLKVRENITTRDDYASMVFMKLRMDTVARIARHDGELALDFLKATAPTDENPRPGIVARERAFEAQLAAQVVANNPELSLKIGRQSLSRGFSEDLLSLLKQLYRKNRELGVTLYKEIVRKMRDTDFTTTRNSVDFVRSLAGNFTPPVADESAFRELMNTLTTAVINNRCGKAYVDSAAYFCDQVRIFIPQMQKLDPVHAAQLEHLAPSRDRQAREITSSRWAELEQALDMGDLNDVLALAKKYPDMEATIYWQAVMKAQADGDSERARKIANDFGGDPEVRQRLLAQVKAREESNSVTEEELARVQSELEKMTIPTERIGYLATVANKIGATNRAAALKLLDQATAIVETQKPGKEQTLNQLALALLYCVEQSDRGLAMMESLLPKLNELIDAAAKLDGFDTNYLRDGEWNMSKDGPLGEMLTYLSENIAQYAWCDFDRAVNLAAQFERNEIRMMAHVKLAQSILAGPPKRLQLSTHMTR